MNTSNPLLAEWKTPYGLPPFDLIKAEHFGPALDAAMEAHKAEIASLAARTDEPSFENTILAFESSGGLLRKAADVFSNLTSSLSNEELQKVELEYSPKLQVHMAGLYLNAALFARVDSVYARREKLGLSPIQMRLVERIRLDFVLSGALLSPDKKKRLEDIVRALSEKTTLFGQYVLADEEETYVLIEKEADLEGLPADLVAAAAELAAAKGQSGKWAISVSRSMVEPFLSHSKRRELRKKVHAAFAARGEIRPERDTKPLIKEILALRAEMAQLHGFNTYAEYALQDRMAKTPAAVQKLLDQIWPAALKRAAEEKKILLEFASAKDGLSSIEAWDWLYYAEKIGKRDYEIDEAEIKPYFSLDAMVEAAFDAAGRLFGIEFKEVKGVPLYHPDAKLFEVREKSGGKLKGVFISDNLARAGKRSGAWMSNYREQSEGVIPIVTNNNNFTRGKPGEPILLSFDDVRTLFHEFGHGLHGLVTDVPYRSLSGTNVLRDFVELPSQLFEHWALAPEILTAHAKHAATGAVIPEALVEKIKKSSTHNMGWTTVQLVGPTLLDMMLHDFSNLDGFDAARFEREECEYIGLPPEVGLRHRLPHFQHLFADNGYAAGYYVYLWAEVLESDAFAAFEEKGNLFDPELARKLKDFIYAAGNSRDPAVAFRAFRGRDPVIEPLLRQRGLI